MFRPIGHPVPLAPLYLDNTGVDHGRRLRLKNSRLTVPDSMCQKIEDAIFSQKLLGGSSCRVSITSFIVIGARLEEVSIRMSVARAVSMMEADALG